VFDGDTLYADTEVLEARESRSRKGWGIVIRSPRNRVAAGTTTALAFSCVRQLIDGTLARRKAPQWCQRY